MAVNLSTMDFNQLPLVLNQLQQQLTALTDKVNKHDDILARLDALEKENQDLKQQLQAKDLVIKKLQGAGTGHTNSSGPARPQGEQDTRSKDTTSSQDTAKSFAKIATAAAHRPDPSIESKKQMKRRIAASRMFKAAATKGPQGYQYVYIGRSRKLLRSEIRSSFKDAGIDVGRILDICFPGSEAIGILLHVQYAEEFIDLVTNKCEAELITDFDPLDPNNIADPKYQDLSLQERHALIYKITETRCLQTLAFLRPLNVSGVGKYFLDQGWIGTEDLSSSVAAAAKRYATKDPKKAKFYFRRKLDTADSASDEEPDDEEDLVSENGTGEAGSDMEH